jgi:hypothetical protein
MAKRCLKDEMIFKIRFHYIILGSMQILRDTFEGGYGKLSPNEGKRWLPTLSRDNFLRERIYIFFIWPILQSNSSF